MTAHTMTTEGRTVRSAHPYPAGTPCPRARQMADLMADIVARDGHVTAEELRQRGFSSAEITEHLPVAQTILAAGDRLPEIDRAANVLDKARLAMVWQIPVMGGQPQPTGVQRALWSDYCRAVAAHKLDPSTDQLVRTAERLDCFLSTLPLLPSEQMRIRNAAIRAVDEAARRTGDGT